MKAEQRKDSLTQEYRMADGSAGQGSTALHTDWTTTNLAPQRSPHLGVLHVGGPPIDASVSGTTRCADLDEARAVLAQGG